MTGLTPTVLIPGLNCNARVYAGQVQALWDYGPVYVANHMVGTTIPAIAGHILAAAPQRFRLVGISMGGYIAFEIMRRAPERVERLALLDTSARADEADQSDLRRKRMAMTASGRYRKVLDQLYPLLVGPARRDDEQIRRVVMQMGEENGRAAFIRHSQAIIDRVDSRGDLATIACPTLVLVGDSDAITVPVWSEEIALGIPDAELVIVPDCGHLSTLERPDAVNAALTRWLLS